MAKVPAPEVQAAERELRWHLSMGPWKGTVLIRHLADTHHHKPSATYRASQHMHKGRGYHSAVGRCAVWSLPPSEPK